MPLKNDLPICSIFLFSLWMGKYMYFSYIFLFLPFDINPIMLEIIQVPTITKKQMTVYIYHLINS